MNQCVRLGLVGIGAVLASNLITWALMRRSGAAFFSEEWWSVWFVNDLIWIVFLVIGIAQQPRSKREP